MRNTKQHRTSHLIQLLIHIAPQKHTRYNYVDTVSLKHPTEIIMLSHFNWTLK